MRVSAHVRFGTRALGTLLILALLLAGVLPAHAPDEPAREIVERGIPAPGLRVHVDPESGLSTILADVMVDEEFIALNGTDWRDALDLMLDAANNVLGDVGVRIGMVSVTSWESDDDQTHMSGILDEALVGAQRGSGRLMLAVTCQDSVRFDGIARNSASAVVVRHVHHNWQQNGSLIAHEVAHLLGADHHAATDECESDGCLMEKAGYAHATEWCDDHRQTIEAYLATLAI